MPVRTIAVGRDYDPGKGLVDLILLPGESAPDARPGLTVLSAPNLPGVLYALREVFSSHEAIASLGGAEVIGSHPWTAAVETRLIEFLEDLGNTPIDSWQGARNAILNGPAIAAGSTTAQLAGALKGFPAICIGAGPSATPEALAHIARLAKTHYIFACDAMTHACRYSGIVPHFVAMLERVPETTRLVLGADESSTLIAPAVIDPASTAQFQRHCWFWGGDDLYTWLDPSTPRANLGRSAGTISIAAAILAGCSPIYLVGHDLSYGTDAAGHSPAAHDFAISGQIQTDAAAVDGIYCVKFLDVPSYSGASVPTNGMWNLMRGDIEALVAANPETEVISAQDGKGAAISGVISGRLPAYGPLEHVPSVCLPKVTVANGRQRIPSILADIRTVRGCADECLDLLPDCDDSKLTDFAVALGVSKMVRPANVPLFRYVFRSINYGLMLRLHLRAEGSHDRAGLQRECLMIQARTISAIASVMEAELCPTH